MPRTVLIFSMLPPRESLAKEEETEAQRGKVSAGVETTGRLSSIQGM